MKRIRGYKYVTKMLRELLPGDMRLWPHHENGIDSYVFAMFVCSSTTTIQLPDFPETYVAVTYLLSTGHVIHVSYLEEHYNNIIPLEVLKT